MKVLKRFAVGVYIVVVVFAAGKAIEAGASSNRLIPFALPGALLLIGLMRVLRGRAELAGWAVFTAWLGLTYLATGEKIAPIEFVAFAVYLICALIGSVRVPYLLVAAWLLHPVWDFVPRTLPRDLKDLPYACIPFDIAIGLYLLWAIRAGWWQRSDSPSPGR